MCNLRGKCLVRWFYGRFCFVSVRFYYFGIGRCGIVGICLVLSFKNYFIEFWCFLVFFGKVRCFLDSIILGYILMFLGKGVFFKVGGLGRSFGGVDSM